MSRLVFTRERRDAFWTEVAELLNRYPETQSGLAVCFGEQDAADDDDEDMIKLHGPFDDTSPVMPVGMVLIVGVRNMQGYEMSFVTSPMEQSDFMTDGLIVGAYKNI